MNIYLFIIVPAMAIMCVLFVCLIAGDVKAIMRSMRKDVNHESIRPHKRIYGQAAVFVGTACLFIGTQTECDELCDDLWHYGQQAEVQQLTGEETQFDVL